MESSFTLRNPPSTYLKIRVTQAQKPSFTQLDEISVRTYLNLALNQYLGLTGMAVQSDILKVEDQTTWIRVSTEDESPVVAALAQWSGKGGISLRVQGRSAWLGALVDDENDEKLWSLEK